jgi:crotonobetainyl-CoA:carnitine CoA-transferase CaiB-like acyl-CoA transferase
VDPQLRARELDVTIRVPAKDASEQAASVTMPKTPLRMTGAQIVAEPGPALGAHTKQLIAEARARRSKL